MNDKNYSYERRALQVLIFIGACVPVFAGAKGMIFGSTGFGESIDISLDSHVRYLSGLLLAIGLSFWSLIPNIQDKIIQVRLLTFLVVVGGCGRLAAAIFIGMPSMPMFMAIGMELIVTPLFCLWQSRVYKLSNKNLHGVLA